MSTVELVNETALVRVDPGALLAQAIDKGASVEQLERLLAMRRELKAEFAREQYFAALAKFQAGCPNIAKGRKVRDKHGKHRYNYAPLDVIVTAVKEGLDLHGFSYTVSTKQDDKSVTAECHAHHIDGHSEVSSFTIPMDPAAYMNESQKIASAMTYAKRYAFCNAFGIMTSDADDDARGTSEDAEQIEPETGEPETEVAWAECGRPPEAYWQAKDHVGKRSALVAAFGVGGYKVEKTDTGWHVFKEIGKQEKLPIEKEPTTPLHPASVEYDTARKELEAEIGRLATLAGGDQTTAARQEIATLRDMVTSRAITTTDHLTKLKALKGTIEGMVADKAVL